MKIHLTGPTVRNDGSYVDAGVDLDVGDEPNEISLARATQLLDGYGRAEDALLLTQTAGSDPVDDEQA
jgi:hypothetical protein